MELDGHAANHAVREILDRIVQALPSYRWERICTYADGLGTTILEVTLYRSGGSETAAVITYQAENGRLLKFQYGDMKPSQDDHLVDVLLDVQNGELRRASKE